MTGEQAILVSTNYVLYICSRALDAIFLFSAVNADKIAEEIVSCSSASASGCIARWNTLVRLDPLPIVFRSGFAFRRVIRSASGTLFLPVRKDEKNRLYRYIHPTRAVITVATRCYGQSAGASLKSFRGCCSAVALIPVVFIESLVARPWRLNPTHRNTRELLMMPIAERYARKEPERDYGAAGCGYQWITTVW